MYYALRQLGVLLAILSRYFSNRVRAFQSMQSPWNLDRAFPSKVDCMPYHHVELWLNFAICFGGGAGGGMDGEGRSNTTGRSHLKPTPVPRSSLPPRCLGHQVTKHIPWQARLRTRTLVEASLERAIAVAARNFAVCVRTRAKTLRKPSVFAVSKRAPPAALVSQSVPVDLPDPQLLLPRSGEAMAAGNQKRVGWCRGPLSIQAATVAFLPTRRMEGRNTVEGEGGAVVGCQTRILPTKIVKRTPRIQPRYRHEALRLSTTPRAS
jgi:hypothetical protein